MTHRNGLPVELTPDCVVAIIDSREQNLMTLEVNSDA